MKLIHIHCTQSIYNLSKAAVTVEGVNLIGMEPYLANLEREWS